MCKRKINIGLLVCSLSMAQAFGLEPELQQLTLALGDLENALQGEVVPPPPPFDRPAADINLPPPPPPSDDVVKPIDIGKLPPPPFVPPVVTPPAPKPPVQPIGNGTAPTPPPPPPAPVQPVKPAGPGLSDITNVQLKPKVTPDKPLKPVVTPIGGGMPSAEALAQQRKEREERMAASKRKRDVGPITDRFVKADAVFAAYPTVATITDQIAAKDFAVEKETITAIGIKSNTLLNQITSNLFTQEDKKGKQVRAKKMLNGLLFYSRNNVIQPEQIKQVAELVVLILNIDPLLITTADAVFRQLGFDDAAIHRLMIMFFEERIRFIQMTLEELKKQATEGAIQDIDEAFAYSIALSGEMTRQEGILLDEHSTNAQKQEAQKFIDRVKELRKQLCAILTAPDNIKLFDTKPALQALYLMICGQQQKGTLKVYCVSAPYTYGKTLAGKQEGQDYVICGFDQEIAKIMQEIGNFKQLKANEISTSQRVYTVQTIINSLEDINTFFTNPDVCPNCLRRAIVSGHPGAQESRQVAEPFRQQLAEISDFLLAINKRDNSFYLEEFVRNGVPKIKATLDRVRKLTDDESGKIYNLIGINRNRRAQGLQPLTLENI